MTLQRCVCALRHNPINGNHKSSINRMVDIELGATCPVYHVGGSRLSYFC